MSDATRIRQGRSLKSLDDYAREALGRSIETPAGCWEYQGYIRPDGYGQVGRNMSAHRVTWMYLRGDLPDDLVIDHLCRNRACCNPWHLDPVPSGLNVMRGVGFSPVNAAKEVCVNGHPFTEDNIYYRPDRYGRMCRTCRREANRRQYWRNPELCRQRERDRRITAAAA